MGAQQSAPQQTQSQSQRQLGTPDQLRSQSFVTATQAKEIGQLSPEEKKQLVAAVREQQKTADKQIKKIIQEASKKAKKDKKDKRKVELPKELSKAEKQKLQSLPAPIHLQAQKKIEEVIKARDSKAKKIVAAEIKKHKRARHGCTAWVANKRANPTKPKNPTTGRAVEKNKKTYNLINKVCKTKKESCGEPGRSPFRGRKALKPESREKALIEGICAKKH